MRVAPSIIVVLCYLFNLSLNSSKLPYQWKQAVVIPIYKKGCRRNVLTNYRPISLTCVMCRLFEGIISEKVLIHLLGNDLISPNQHGFVPGKSAHTQLISVLNKWYCSYDNNLDIDVVYADLAKALALSHILN